MMKILLTVETQAATPAHSDPEAVEVGIAVVDLVDVVGFAVVDGVLVGMTVVEVDETGFVVTVEDPPWPMLLRMLSHLLLGKLKKSTIESWTQGTLMGNTYLIWFGVWSRAPKPFADTPTRESEPTLSVES